MDMKFLDKLTDLFSRKAEVAEAAGQKFNDLNDDRTRLKAFERICWNPITEEGDGAITGSKFGGVPYLRSDEEWPTCLNCSKPMQLFLQLNPLSLPYSKRGLWGDGLLQFFYCTTSEPLCEVDGQTWAPFSECTKLRVAQINGEGLELEVEPVNDPFPTRQIIGWEAADDFPGMELEELGHAFEIDPSDDYFDLFPRSGDKLLGWPLWIQGVEYPNCPICDRQMQLLFQIDSNDNLPYMFGDAGIGHISHCPEHLQELGFGWACS
jgi:uncharacterized protein YwqG